jgi:glycosyltransferase involved in cell wall biosynthesis
LVVATDIRGNRALVEDRQNGLLFQDERTFVEAVLWARQHPGDALQMRQKARWRVWARHSARDEVARYLDLYRQCRVVRGCSC